jgi:hypothetical protein
LSVIDPFSCDVQALGSPMFAQHVHHKLGHCRPSRRRQLTPLRPNLLVVEQTELDHLKRLSSRTAALAGHRRFSDSGSEGFFCAPEPAAAISGGDCLSSINSSRRLSSAAKWVRGELARVIGRQIARSNIQAGNSSQRPDAAPSTLHRSVPISLFSTT